MILSAEERAAQALTPEHLTLALQSLRESGYVIIDRALPAAWVTRMRTACNRELKQYLKDPTRQKQFLQDAKGHVGMYPPRTMPFMDPLAVENPFAFQIMEAALGKDLCCIFYNTNTAWPGSGTQHTHRDTPHLFPEVPFPLPVSSVVVNIPLVDFTIENGSTEVWPGTHHITDLDPEDRQQLDVRAAALPSVRVNMPAGSVVVRDLRLWHRGTPNTTRTIRTMLAIVYLRAFHRLGGETLTIPNDIWDGLSERGKRVLRHNIVEKAGRNA